MEMIFDKLESVIRYFVFAIIVFLIFTCMVAMFNNDNAGEASIGSFDVNELNTGWTADYGKGVEEITLPCKLPVQKEDIIELNTTLPEDIHDGMTLATRSAMSEMFIYIDGKLRSSYCWDDIATSSMLLQSEFIVTEIGEADAGKLLTIKIRALNDGKINKVYFGNGNNFWFRVFKEYLFNTIVGIILIILGVAVAIVYKILARHSHVGKAFLYIGLLMLDMGFWVISESQLRQLYFKRPVITDYMTYVSIEVVGILVGLFFDQVQHRKYHIRYTIVEMAISILIIVNAILNEMRIASFHDTLKIAHAFMLVGLVVAGISIAQDIISKEIKKYYITAIGMLLFGVFCIMEIVLFYVARLYTLGLSACLGLVVLLIATAMQTIYDEMMDIHSRERQKDEQTISTIETIASSIDAKDEYTGGHSYRVGEYARIIAREMAADYDLSEEDILRIGYIGKLHDIGKIGVADNILNKAGRLTDDEFNLMKKHVIIGHELMKGITGIEGLADGIKYHHERFDGGGYPEGIEGTDIPLVARILCVADCYDAMTSNRVYRKRLTDEEVRAEIERCSGTQFDPAISTYAMRLIDKGMLRPITIDGLETGDYGHVLKSSLLENVMQRDDSKGEAILHHSHVRMISYVMKLAEKNNKSMHALFVECLEPEVKDSLNAYLKSRVNNYDMCIDYKENIKLIVLFGLTQSKCDNWINSIESEIAGIKVTTLESMARQE